MGEGPFQDQESTKPIQTAISASACISRRVRLENHTWAQAPGPSESADQRVQPKPQQSGRRNRFPTSPRDTLPLSQSSRRPRSAAFPQAVASGVADTSQARLKKLCLKSRCAPIQGLARNPAPVVVLPPLDNYILSPACKVLGRTHLAKMSVWESDDLGLVALRTTWALFGVTTGELAASTRRLGLQKS